MDCYIYKSRKKPDYYLYIDIQDDFSRVPDDLLKLLGNLEFVFEIQLDQNTRLASSDPSLVLQGIELNGYYLQVPPKVI